MTLQQIFENNNKIVINSDIDGFLSGMLLRKYYNCEIVGFSNSQDKIWLTEEIDDIYSPVYIDLYVNNPRTTCIEQHVLAYDDVELGIMRTYANKLNPIFERGNSTFKKGYYWKYPFGTVHYLLNLMEREGKSIDLPPLGTKKSIPLKNSEYQICPGQILLRADDAMLNTAKYSDNASQWWEWLNPNKEYAVFNQIAEYLEQYTDKDDAQKVEDETDDFFIKGLGCDGKDGAFFNIAKANTQDSNNNEELNPAIYQYIKVINDLMQTNLFVPKHYICHEGRAIHKDLTSKNDISNYGDSLFSYAIIWGPNNTKEQLSLTLNME
jgi:hypothetical protein